MRITRPSKTWESSSSAVTATAAGSRSSNAMPTRHRISAGRSTRPSAAAASTPAEQVVVVQRVAIRRRICQCSSSSSSNDIGSPRAFAAVDRNVFGDREKLPIRSEPRPDGALATPAFPSEVRRSRVLDEPHGWMRDLPFRVPALTQMAEGPRIEVGGRLKQRVGQARASLVGQLTAQRSRRPGERSASESEVTSVGRRAGALQAARYESSASRLYSMNHGSSSRPPLVTGLGTRAEVSNDRQLGSRGILTSITAARVLDRPLGDDVARQEDGDQRCVLARPCAHREHARSRSRVVC